MPSLPISALPTRIRTLAAQSALLILVTSLFGCATVSNKPHYSSVVAYALSLQGAPYRYGKSSPEEGFDCSGFVQHVYAEQGVALPRTVSEMIASLPHVPKSDLHAGDLVFFTTQNAKPSHVGLYVDEQTFIHAPSNHTGKVTLSSLDNQYWSKRFIGVRRPAAPSK